MADIVSFTKEPKGKELYKLYMENVKEEELTSMREKAQKLVNDLVEEIQKNIKANKPPIGMKSSIRSSLGIIAHDTELEKLFSNFLFSAVLKQVASEEYITIEPRQTATMNPKEPTKPIVGLEIVATIDIDRCMKEGK